MRISEFCTKMSHLTISQQSKVRHFLDFQGIFSTSTEINGSTNIKHFDVNVEKSPPSFCSHVPGIHAKSGCSAPIN